MDAYYSHRASEVSTSWVQFSLFELDDFWHLVDAYGSYGATKVGASCVQFGPIRLNNFEHHVDVCGCRGATEVGIFGYNLVLLVSIISGIAWMHVVPVSNRSRYIVGTIWSYRT